MDNISVARAFSVKLNDGGSAHCRRGGPFTDSTTAPGDIVSGDGCNNIGGVRLCGDWDDSCLGICVIIRVVTTEADKYVICKTMETSVTDSGESSNLRELASRYDAQARKVPKLTSAWEFERAVH